MISLLDIDKLGYATLDLPGISGKSEGEQDCPRCEGFRPDPQPEGNLVVDRDGVCSS